jgi:hypothetical protein
VLRLPAFLFAAPICSVQRNVALWCGVSILWGGARYTEAHDEKCVVVATPRESVRAQDWRWALRVTGAQAGLPVLLRSKT